MIKKILLFIGFVLTVAIFTGSVVSPFLRHANPSTTTMYLITILTLPVLFSTELHHFTRLTKASLYIFGAVSIFVVVNFAAYSLTLEQTTSFAFFVLVSCLFVIKLIFLEKIKDPNK